MILLWRLVALAATIVDLLFVWLCVRIPTDRYDWAVLYQCIVALVCILPVGVLELWLCRYWYLSSFFGPIAGAAVFFAIVAVVKRDKPWRVLIYLLISVVLCWINLNRGLAVAIEIRYFENNRDLYDKSVASILALQGKKRKLPARFECLTSSGYVRYFQDPDSLNEFLLYPKIYNGIGNGVDYVWSRSDAWPNTVLHFEGCYVQRTGSNWFYVRYP